VQPEKDACNDKIMCCVVSVAIEGKKEILKPRYLSWPSAQHVGSIMSMHLINQSKVRMIFHTFNNGNGGATLHPLLHPASSLLTKLFIVEKQFWPCFGTIFFGGVIIVANSQLE